MCYFANAVKAKDRQRRRGENQPFCFLNEHCDVEYDTAARRESQSDCLFQWIQKERNVKADLLFQK